MSGEMSSDISVPMKDIQELESKIKALDFEWRPNIGAFKQPRMETLTLNRYNPELIEETGDTETPVCGTDEPRTSESSSQQTYLMT